MKITGSIQYNGSCNLLKENPDSELAAVLIFFEIKL